MQCNTYSGLARMFRVFEQLVFWVRQQILVCQQIHKFTDQHVGGLYLPLPIAPPPPYATE